MEIHHLPEDFTIIDVETTGLDIEKDRLIEVCAIRIRSYKSAGTFHSYIDPGILIPEDSPTGLTDEFMRDKPLACTVMPDYLTFIGDDILVGHNVPFDIRFLRAESGCDIPNPYLDTCAIARDHLSLPSYRLPDLCDFFGIQHDHDHSARGDCVSTYGVFMKLLALYSVQENLPKPTPLKRHIERQDQYAESETVDYSEAQHIMQELKKKTPDLFAGQRIVFTGIFTHLPRLLAEKFVKATGGTTGDVTKTTTCLVQGSDLNLATDGKSGKTKKAEKYGIPILTEDEFIARLKEILSEQE